MPDWTLHLIEPRDALIARDGKPFNNDPGARASTLPFPFPSTTTGGVRTRAGLDAGGNFNFALADPVKAIRVRGPLLAELAENGARFLAPSPRDCVLLEPRDAAHDKTRWARLKQLVPASVPGDLQTDAEIVTAFSNAETEETKALTGPRFWNWPQFSAWLASSDSSLVQTDVEFATLGHDGPLRDERTHVRLHDETLGHDIGGLFSTQGLVFRRQFEGENAPRSLALAVWSDMATHEFEARDGVGHLGGERRLVTWGSTTQNWPRCEWIEAITRAKACRAVLLTPAFFTQGWKPKFLLEACEGVRPELLAACVGRAEVVSGWDFQQRQAKPTRRLVPSGSTYFLRLRDEHNPTEDASEENIKKWVDARWFSPISDTPEARADGFGLLALGVGDKEPREGLLS